MNSRHELMRRLAMDSDWTALCAGRVDVNDVVLWARVAGRDRPHRLTVSTVDGDEVCEADVPPPHRDADGTTVLRLSEATGTVLAANTVYRAHLWLDDELVGQARFRTAPDRSASPDDVSIGWVSCNQPFDDDGRFLPIPRAFLRDVHREYDARGVRAIVLAGDQAYADEPQSLSVYDDSYFELAGPDGRADVFACDRAEVRALWHRRHRESWKAQEFRSLMSNWPCWPIYDDHEVVDNWGSDPAHAEARWDAIREGALDAIFDYQAARVLGPGTSRPASFDFGQRMGPLAVYVPDLRSRRHHDGACLRIVTGEQLGALRAFADEHADAAVLAIVLSVPVLHVPDAIVSAGSLLTEPASDFDDRWSTPAARASRADLLDALGDIARSRPERRVVLLGGDIHVATLSRLSWSDETPDIVQATSSPLSNLDNPWFRRMAKVLPEASTRGLRRQHGDLRVELFGGDVNPFAGLNAGVLSLRRRGDRYETRVEILGASMDEPGPARVVIDSGWL